MGTYLTTAIIPKFSVSKSDVDTITIATKGDEEKSLKKIQEVIGGKGEAIFDVVKRETSSEWGTSVSYDFTLKESVLKKEWIPFLSTFYKDFYGGYGEWESVIKQLEAKEKPKDWLELADSDKDYYQCYRSDYGFRERYKIAGQRIETWGKVIMLSLEGKVMAEESDAHFSFFEEMIAQAYKNFRIAKMMRVFITG